MKEVILIVAPLESEAIFRSYLAIHALINFHNFHKEKAEFHIIVREDLIDSFRYLSCKVNYHVIKKEQFNFFGIHKYIVNLRDIRNVDVAFDFQGDFLTSFMMFNIRATKRFCIFKEGTRLGTIFHNTEVHRSQDTLDLVRLMYPIDVEKIGVLGLTKKMIQKEDHFLSIFFSDVTGFVKDAEKLKLFLNEFDYFSIGVFIDQIEYGGSESLKQCHEEHFKNLKIGFKFGQENWGLPDILIRSSIIISNQMWPCYLSAYNGLPSMFWGNQSLIPGMKGYLDIPSSIEIDDSSMVTLNSAYSDIHSAVDKIFELFKIERAPAEEGLDESEEKITL